MFRLAEQALAQGGSRGEVLGLDVGGAHLKAAFARNGRIVAARQVPCRLWEGLDRLAPAFDKALDGLPAPGRVALTMTGELADLFPDRATGVTELIAAVRDRLPDTLLAVWAGREGFLAPELAMQRPAAVASANWLATASLAASRAGNGLLVDIGSTTTDILPLVAGAVRFTGYSDAERLASGELVYQGLTRTPVMAMADKAPLGGRWVPLMNEYFATAADVWRLLGRLDEAHDQHLAADNGPKTPEASARRLARMVGADLGEAGPIGWYGLAEWLAQAQLRRIEDALRLVLSREKLADKAPLIGAGCGRFLVARLADAQGRPYLDLAELIQVEPAAADMAATCAPAVAVALLPG
jgi:probable H4MPT-linked C1 transfer pathway protein